LAGRPFCLDVSFTSTGCTFYLYRISLAHLIAFVIAVWTG